MKKRMEIYVLCMLLTTVIFPPAVTGMRLPWRFSVTVPNEMMTSDSQVPESIKGNVKISWELRHLKPLVQKGRGLNPSRSLPITKRPSLTKSTAFFFNYDDTDREKLDQISRFIGETPKQKIKVDLNQILRIIQTSYGVLLILFLCYQLLWRCYHFYVIRPNKRNFYYLSQI